MRNQHHQTGQIEPQQEEKSTGKRKYPIARTRGARFTLSDARAIAELVALRLNQREACHTLGIPYQTFANWKQHVKNDAAFAEILDTIKGNTFRAHLENIKAASVGKGPHQRADWRASESYLRLTDARFSPAGMAVQVNVEADSRHILNVARFSKTLSRMIAEKKRKAQIVDVQEVKQLPENCDIPISATSEDKKTRHD